MKSRKSASRERFTNSPIPNWVGKKLSRDGSPFLFTSQEGRVRSLNFRTLQWVNWKMSWETTGGVCHGPTPPRPAHTLDHSTRCFPNMTIIILKACRWRHWHAITCLNYAQQTSNTNADSRRLHTLLQRHIMRYPHAQLNAIIHTI